MLLLLRSGLGLLLLLLILLLLLLLLLLLHPWILHHLPSASQHDSQCTKCNIPVGSLVLAGSELALEPVLEVVAFPAPAVQLDSESAVPAVAEQVVCPVLS